MDFSLLTRSRRTVHNYKPESLQDSVVEEALRLSLWAPNHKLTYPWAYYWTGPATRARLADLAVELKGAKEPLSEIKKQAVRANVLNPSHLILLGVKRGDPKREHEDYATLACSVQIATLYLWEQGVGTKWSTGGGYMHPRTYEILGVSPDEVRLEGGLLIGVPQMAPPVPERPAVGEFIHRLT